MQLNKRSIGGGGFPKKKLQRAVALICLLAAMPMFCGTNASATQLVWDAGSAGVNTTGTAVSGSGIWDTNVQNLSWFNGTADVAWPQANQNSGTYGAVFNGPDAAPGTYQILLDTNQVAFTNLAFNNNGYYVYGPNALFSYSGPVQIANGVSVTISNSLIGVGNQFVPVVLGTGSTLTLLGNPGRGAGLVFASANNGGTVYLGNNTGTPYSFTSGMDVNATVVITNGVYTDATGSLNVGRNVGPFQGQTIPTAGTLIVDGSSTVLNVGTAAVNVGLNIGNNTGQGKVVVQNGGTVNAGVNAGGGVSGSFSTATATYRGRLEIDGGAFNIGFEGVNDGNNQLGIMGGGCSPGATFTMYQTNGSFSAAGGIVIGGSGTYSGGYVGITNAGGFFNIGPGGNNGISLLAQAPQTNYITFSGGTVTTWGGSWSTALPITLATQNGNITFQCADNASGSPYNISLKGPLSGPGGLNETGGGVLTLGAQNTYVGSTVVSNGTLVVQTATLSTNGPVIVDGSAGNPILSLVVGNGGQTWSISKLTYQNGLPTSDFNFGVAVPSTTVAPIQCSGSVAFSVAPNITVEGSAIPTNTYPLIQYASAPAGTIPASVTFASSSASAGYVTNIAARKIIALVVTQSSYAPAITWRIGGGAWDFTSANWTANGVAAKYIDGDTVKFDDSASGVSPISITLDTTVNPGAITAGNVTKAYTVSGNGGIAGSASLAILGAAPFTLATTNTYFGGTTVNPSSQLDINFGGDTSGTDSAIGTGALTLDAGAILDNTSGRAVSLVPTIPEYWAGSWTNNGSGNFSTGPGTINLEDNVVVVTVISNTLSIPGQITDNGNGDKLVKMGAGALTLGSDNQFSGGVALVSGTLNLGSPGCLGSGSFVINGGAIDNVSEADLFLYGSGINYAWAGSFSFLGTGNLDLGTTEIIPSSPLTVNVVSNTFTTEGDIVSGNTTLTKTGAGTWVVAGNNTANNLTVLTVTVNQGELDLARAGGNAIGSGGSAASTPGASGWGLVVQSNALAKVTGTANQIYVGKKVPLVLNSGGTYDINGANQSIDLVAMNNGIVRNGLSTSYSTLTVATNELFELLSGNCVFDVPSADSSLTLSAVISGTGNLVKTGLGTVTLVYSNNYQGNITVSGGTLSLTFPDITNTAVVTIATNGATGTNGVLNLNFANSDTVTVAGLVVGGVSKPAGLYSATTDPLYITGSGSLLVVPPAINPLAGPLQFNVTGRTLALSWPTNSGWILESQTNSLAAGLGTNWVAVPGSTSVTSTNITIDPANGDVYFRLAHP